MAARFAFRSAFKAGLVVGAFGFGSWVVLRTGQPEFLFSPAFRSICWLQRPLTGLSVGFDSVQGDLSEGQLSFKNLRVKWQDTGLFGLVPQKFRCDLTAEQLSVNLGHDNAEQLLRNTQEFVRRIDSLEDTDTVVFPLVSASGVKGDFTMLIRHPETPLPNVVIKALALSDVSVTLADGFRRPQPLVFPPLRIDALRMDPYRVRRPVNAVFFSGAGKGAFGDRPFSFGPAANGRSIDASVPVELVGHRFLRPPLSWISHGTLRVQVQLQPKGPRKWLASANVAFGDKVTVQGPAGEEDGLFGQATSQIVSYLSSNQVSVQATEEINEDVSNEDKFLNELGAKFAVLVVAKAGAAAFDQLKKKTSSWW